MTILGLDLGLGHVHRVLGFGSSLAASAATCRAERPAGEFPSGQQDKENSPWGSHGPLWGRMEAGLIPHGGNDKAAQVVNLEAMAVWRLCGVMVNARVYTQAAPGVWRT